MFPAKPARTPGQRPPGRVVPLRTNLYKVFIRQNADIFETYVAVEWKTDAKSKASGDSKPPDRTEKIGNKFRREAVEVAIKRWLHNNQDTKKKGLSYAIDSNGSIMYSLFSLFPDNSPKEASFSIDVSIQVDSIVGQKLVKQEKKFVVRFIKGSNLKMNALFQWCNKEISADRDQFEPHRRALNVILRSKINTIEHMVVTPMNIFPYLKEEQFKVSEDVFINRGFSTGIRPAEIGPVLNVANTVAAFHEEIGLVNLLQARFGVRDLNQTLRQDTAERFLKEIKTKQVEATHINYGKPNKPHYRKYRVTGLTPKGADQEKFTLVDKQTKASREISIADYFKEQYKIKLRYPKLPCINDGGRKIPLELCHIIEKQRVLRKMDPNETSEIIKRAALPPQKHFELVDKNMKELCKYKEPFNDFGLDFQPKPIEVDGRELMPINLIDGSNQTIVPHSGGYEGSRSRFLKPARVIKSWGLCFLMDRRMSYDRNRGFNEDTFARFYVDIAKKRGVSINPNYNTECIDMTQPERQAKARLKEFLTLLNGKKVDHIIFVLPDDCPDWTYRYLQYLEVTTGGSRPPGEWYTRNSCIKYSNYTRKIITDRSNGSMFLNNLWLKYNTKFGGINFALKSDGMPFFKDTVVFISVDVCHPAPGDKLSQSVAAVVGMWDISGPNMSFCTRLRVQKKVREDHSTIEDVGEIDKMVEEILLTYREKKKKFPAAIVILRDGVSEGQFRIVLRSEITKVKANVNNLYKKNKIDNPKITCLVVQKRHKVRFIRKVPVVISGKEDFNIQPGTVVDSMITHPSDFAFYLAPHKAIQGTSKAPHIFIICDELKLSQDVAQAMVHALSYLSPRCTKGTSIPTPVNLADLAAEQGKNLVVCWNDENAGQMSEDARLKKLNSFLSNIGDSNYKNTLYYI